MDRLINKYSRKLVSQKICDNGKPIFGVLDEITRWSSGGEEVQVLESVMQRLSINSILFSPAAEPYRSILDYLADHSTDTNGRIKPDDTETRTFLHDIPVAQNFSTSEILKGLMQRKGVIIPGCGIVTYGAVSPEQAFVTYSSICFSSFVKFMADYYYHVKGIIPMKGDPEPVFTKAVQWYRESLSSVTVSPVNKAPFRSPEDVINAIIETGRLTVQSGMVDSFFGNISVRYGDIIYISQTGSSLDELSGCIDPCPMDNSTTNAITASSEFSAHKALYSMTERKSILHGHPKFSVTMSMLCDDLSCLNRGRCHIRCSRGRCIEDVPVVPGEIGTGPNSLSRTMPSAMKGRGVIVWGHGLFTSGVEDFTDAYKNLLDIEKMCFEKYLSLVAR
jgi:ribulose-5-phosphate 4-epimerase/fuculose-1-phosphate aldolase